MIPWGMWKAYLGSEEEGCFKGKPVFDVLSLSDREFNPQTCFMNVFYRYPSKLMCSPRYIPLSFLSYHPGASAWCLLSLVR